MPSRWIRTFSDSSIGWVRRRLDPIDPSWRVESADEAIRAIGPTPSPLDNSLCWAKIDAANADEIIREQIGFFRGLGREMSWPILERLGFRALADVAKCIYRGDRLALDDQSRRAPVEAGN